MLKAFMHRQVEKFARPFGYDAQYMHQIIAASPRAAVKFQLSQWMANHRDSVPLDAWHAARLAAVLCEDCGPCTQLGVDRALQAGVSPHTLEALLREDWTSAGADAALAFRYGQAVASKVPPDALVEEVRARFGARGLVSLCFAVTGVRAYPALKRGLGHGASCSRVTVAGKIVALRQPAEHA